MAECRSCGAQIIWAKVNITETPIPLDPDPTPNGNIAMRQRPYVEVASKDQLAAAKKNKTPLYLSHFVTCPDQDKWKRRIVKGPVSKSDDHA